MMIGKPWSFPNKITSSRLLTGPSLPGMTGISARIA
ncbi:Uncharacterised protein [Mycobacteroides abscessus subsp. abscessus]|nr:Uncharacterised protein [Mycobacteroides abscessus subsp. abscessus]